MLDCSTVPGKSGIKISVKVPLLKPGQISGRISDLAGYRISGQISGKAYPVSGRIPDIKKWPDIRHIPNFQLCFYKWLLLLLLLLLLESLVVVLVLLVVLLLLAVLLVVVLLLEAPTD